jgi:uncharacterized protein YchJ
LIESNRAPAEIMEMYAAKEYTGGRNSFCYCGSGKRFKRCHGAVLSAHL